MTDFGKTVLAPGIWEPHLGTLKRWGLDMYAAKPSGDCAIEICPFACPRTGHIWEHDCFAGELLRHQVGTINRDHTYKCSRCGIRSQDYDYLPGHHIRDYPEKCKGVIEP